MVSVRSFEFLALKPVFVEMYKTNYDGAVFKDSEEAGIRVVVCNVRGEVLAALSEKNSFSRFGGVGGGSSCKKGGLVYKIGRAHV